MKEKIKNFLLNIKKSLCTEIKTPVYKIMLFGILMIILSSISFSCASFVNETFNETHTEQIEEIPQTESMRIEKDLKFANPTSSDYVNPSTAYNSLYFNIYLSSTEFFELMSNVTFYNISSNGFNTPIYPIYCTMDFINSNWVRNMLCIAKVSESLYYIVSLDFSNASSLIDSTYIGSIDSTYGNFLPQLFITRGGGASDYFIVNIGRSNQLLFNLVSSIPFEYIPQEPILSNAPSSLVNTIPSNALTTLPNNLGTKVYDSGSAWVQDPSDYNEYNAFGYQIFYKSNILTSETDMLRFKIDGITYDVEPTIYRYYLSEVYVVIYTLWDDTPIYYVSDNILDTPFPFTLDYVTRFNISDLINWLSVRVDIVETYSDYLHIRFNYDYFMRLTHSDEFVWLIDEESQSFDALIFSTADKPSIIKNDGFMLNIIPELDPKFSKMGQTQTNNMYSTIVHGGTINQVWSNAYHKGVGVGETNGYTNGYNDGIETGKTLQNPINPIMDFISDGASVISNVFDTKIFPGVTDDSPGITLGTMLLFPLAISLIWFVIKLFMGG